MKRKFSNFIEENPDVEKDNKEPENKREKTLKDDLFLTRPIAYTGDNYEEYKTSCLDIFSGLSTVLGQNHSFIPRSTWKYIWGLVLAPLYLQKPEENDIALFIDVNNNEDIYSTIEMKRRIKDGKKPEPLKWTTDHAGYQTAVIRANEIRYHFVKHIAILHGALEIPYYINHNRRKFHVDHKISRTNEGVLSNSIENLQYLSGKVHANKTASGKKRKSENKRSLMVIQYSDRERTREIARFKSGQEASRVTGIPSILISNSCTNIKISTKGFWWKKGDQMESLCKIGKEMVNNVKEWRTAIHPLLGHKLNVEISDNMVVRFPNGRLSIGTPRDDGKRRRIHLDGKNFDTYVLCCAAWKGPRPTPKHHCAHFKEKYIHATYHDLEWQTASENIADAHGKRIQVKNKETGEINEFRTMVLAAKFADFPFTTLATGMAAAVLKPNKTYTPTAEEKKKYEFCFI